MVQLKIPPGGANLDYPVLYTAAEDTSRTARRGYTRLVQLDLLLLLAGSALGVVGALVSPSARVSVWIAAAVIIGATLVVKSATKILRRDRDWIAGRAVAEAVKEATWRYVMRARPFDLDDPAARGQFIGALRSTLATHRDLRLALDQVPDDGHQISESMTRVRALPLDERKEYYTRERLDAQIRWYLARAGKARRAATISFWLDIIARGGALAFAILIIVPPHRGPGIAGLLVAIAAAVTAWAQLGRYDEIGKSYSLTAQHLLLEKSRIEDMDEQGFGQLVGDVEETISGEHAGWLAKRR